MKNFITDTVSKLTSYVSKTPEDRGSISTNTESPVTSTQKTLADCETIEEVSDILSSLADKANQSIAYALTAQLQVIRYISSAELIGSTFDLLFNNVKQWFGKNL